jgi:multidrug efflux pump
MGGMIAATVIGVFLVPLLFVTVRRIFKGRAAKPETGPDTGQETGETPAPANQQ